MYNLQPGYGRYPSWCKELHGAKPKRARIERSQSSATTHQERVAGIDGKHIILDRWA
jgi:hypothetical protein